MNVHFVCTLSATAWIVAMCLVPKNIQDLYVLRRLADVVQPLIRRFTADETEPGLVCDGAWDRNDEKLDGFKQTDETLIEKLMLRSS